MNAGDIAPEQLARAWSLYWRSGRLNSCVDGVSESKMLRDAWREFFDRFDSGTRILDLATGNGAVIDAACASAVPREARFLLTGVDAAETLQPHNIEAARFLPGVRMEALPFEAAYFDVVVSQFGFEYGERAACAREAARVLRPGGRLRLVIHASGGAVHAAAEQSAERLRQALSKRGLLSKLAEFARAEADHARRLEEQVAQLWSGLQPALAGAPSDDAALFYVRSVTRLWRSRQRYAPDELSQSIGEALDRAQSIFLRQRAMLQAACSAQDIELLRALLHDADMETSAADGVFDDAGGQLAWIVDGVKKGDAPNNRG
ncbi:MAG: class I SAM-dependent methyltransferase [Proteobacteria bacterium]|nr:class I SAM-dependent methyltransferase [Pseudomonadota bacterium]